jgi:hypothetical protein
MISETKTARSRAAITSDQWHVIRARWHSESNASHPYAREVVSEHPDRGSAADAARTCFAAMALEMAARPRDQRDQVFVRRPRYKSLKQAARVTKLKT